MLLRIIAAVVVVAVSTSVFADHHEPKGMPNHAKNAISKFVGEWSTTSKVGDKAYEETVAAQWSNNETTLQYEATGFDWTTGAKQTQCGMLGWDGASRSVREVSMASGGGIFTAHHFIGDDDSKWKISVKGFSLSGGKPIHFEHIIQLTWVSDNEFQLRSIARFEDGKAVDPVTSTFKRK